MTESARDAVIAVCVTAVVITTVIVTGNLSVLWLLALLLFVAF